MSVRNRIVPVLSVGILILAGGCRADRDTPTEPEPNPEPLEQSSLFREPLQAAARPHEVMFHRIAAAIPGFAGYWFDEQGSLVALLQDLDAQEEARRYLEPILRERIGNARQRSGAGIRFQRAQFSFLQLAEWRDRATDQVLDLRGVQFTDLDEMQNRFVIGISDSQAREAVARVLAEHDVPLDAVILEDIAPAEEFLTIRGHN